MRIVSVVLASTALAVRLIPLAFGIASTDILLYAQQAFPVMQGKNIYAVTHNVFPYTPVSMFHPALCLVLSGLLGIPFHVVVKLFAILADVGIVLVLCAMGVKVLPKRVAIGAAALYAINPVSILVASFDGNIMPLVVLLMLTAYLLILLDPDENLVASGLLLGLAVGWRSFPILLLPFFLASIGDTAKRIRFAACVVVPPVLSMLPFAWVAAAPMLREVLGYSGWGIQHGLFAIVRGLHLASLGRVSWENPSEWTPWVTASKPAFLVLYGIAALFAKRLTLLQGILVTFFLFELVYAGVASHYLIWPVPFLLLLEGRAMFWIYQVAAAYALVVVYWTFFPDILFGALHVPRVDTKTLLHHYVASQVLFTAVCAVAVFVFGKGVVSATRAPVAAEPVTPTLRRHELGLLGRLVCLYYVLLFAWEIVFVLSLGRPASPLA